MGFKCVVRGCTSSVTKKDAAVTLHRFPENTEACEAWIQRCGIHLQSEVAKINNKRVCSKHFAYSDFSEGNRKLLLQTAIPTRNLPVPNSHELSIRINNSDNSTTNFSLPVTNGIVLRIQIVNDTTLTHGTSTHKLQEVNPTPSCSQSVAAVPKLVVDKTTQEICKLKRKIKILRKELETVKQSKKNYLKNAKFWKSQSKVATHKINAAQTIDKQRLTNKLSKSKQVQTNYSQILDRLFTPKQIHVLLNNKVKPKWTNAEIAKGISLRYKANQYEHLRSLGFPLPSTRTLQRWTQDIHLRPGVIFPVINLLTQHFALASELERQCVISFDEMSIDSSIAYDPVEDQILGPKTNINVWFVRGLFSGWKQPFAFNFDEELSAEKYLKLLEVLENAGLRVRANVNDLGGKNRGLMNQLGVNVRKKGAELITRCSMVNPLSKNNIYNNVNNVNMSRMES